MKNLWSVVNRLENRIEATSREGFADGFVENVFGGFDRADLVEQLIREYSSLPQGPEVAYRHAGALFRARRLEEARKIYDSLLPSNSARLMLAIVENELGGVEAAARLIDEYNAECLRANMPFMRTALEKVAVRKAVNY